MTNPQEPAEVDGEPPVPRSRTSGRAARLTAGCAMLLLFCAGVLVGSAGAIGLDYAAGRDPVLSRVVAFGLLIAGAALATGAFELARWR